MSFDIFIGITAIFDKFNFGGIGLVISMLTKKKTFKFYLNIFRGTYGIIIFIIFI